MFKLIRAHAVTLALFAALTTAMTTWVYHLTSTRILEQTHSERLSLLSEVLPQSLHSTELLSRCVMLQDARLGKTLKPVYPIFEGEQRIGAITEVTAPDGYSGDIVLLVAATSEGVVLGVRTLKHNETPGLGDKIELSVSDWILNFANKRVSNSNDPNWAVKKEGGVFDAFSGATITPRAVINAVVRAVSVIKELDDKLDQLPPCDY